MRRRRRAAKLAIITTRLTAAGFPKVVERVRTLTTPGETIDVLVTEAGIAVNPRRPDLADRLGDAGLRLVGIAALKAEGRPAQGAEGWAYWKWKEVQASVARCLRTPPGPAKAQDFRFRFGYRLRGNGHRSVVVVGNYSL